MPHVRILTKVMKALKWYDEFSPQRVSITQRRSSNMWRPKNLGSTAMEGFFPHVGLGLSSNSDIRIPLYGDISTVSHSPIGD